MAVQRGVSAAFYMQNDAASVAVTGEAFELVSGTTYKVSNFAHAYIDKDQAITIYDGATPVTPTRIVYAGGYVILPSAPAGSVTGDFYYKTVAQMLGGTGWSIDASMETEDSTVFGAAAKGNEPVMFNWSGQLDAFWWPVHSAYSMSMGSNKDLRFVARAPGPVGDAISVEIAVAGNDTPLSVVVTDNAIVINSATDSGGVATSTAMQILDAVQANSAAMDLVRVDLLTGSSGVGIPGVLAHVHLSGGASPTTLAALVAGAELFGVFYTDAGAALARYEGLCVLGKVGVNQKVAGLITSPLSFTGSGMMDYHEGD